MADAAPAILLSFDRQVATITFNRDERMNAFDSAMHAELRHAFERIESDQGVRAVILTGAGRGFCTGAHLGERAAVFERGGTPDLHALLEQNYNPLVRRIAALPVPVIAAVNGVAAGAGAALALACDIVIAAESARFQFTFAKVGLGLDAGGTWLLPRLVGQARAMGIAMTADPIDAATAERFGMIWKAVPDELLASEAMAMAQGFAGGSRQALAAVKRGIRGSADLSLDEALDAERDAQAALAGSHDYREAVLAFSAKRRPQFQ